MKNDNNHESELWKLLEKEKLADLSQFHKPGLVEEVPLYSRLSDISFLLRRERAKANAILLRFALKYLQAVVAYEQHSKPYFAAITVWNASGNAPIIPHLFVCSNSISKLIENLPLNSVKSEFGRRIQRLISGSHLPESFRVLEDAHTAPEILRVFIGPSRAPYPGFVTLSQFRKPMYSAEG